jgi:hypothetical protein
MNRSKILLLSFVKYDDARLADIAKQYFITRQNIDITGGQPEQLNHIIGWRGLNGDYSVPEDPAELQEFLDVIVNDYYFLRYYYYSSWVLPVADLITHIQAEDMTVLRVTRNSIEDLVIDYMLGVDYTWDSLNVLTDADVAGINASAVGMTISDFDLQLISEKLTLSNQLFDIIDAAGLINFDVIYENLPLDNPPAMLAQLFPDPIVPTDVAPIRPQILTDTTRNTIKTNNNLTNRITQFF